MMIRLQVTINHRNSIMRSITLILSLIITSAVVSPLEAGFREAYDTVYKTYQEASKREQIIDVAKSFAKLSERKDAGILIANVYYWQGECYYDLKEYEHALSCFEKALLYPQSNKEEAARFKVAICNLTLGNKATAKWEFSRFLRDYPSSNLAPRVRKELQRLN